MLRNIPQPGKTMYTLILRSTRAKRVDQTRDRINRLADKVMNCLATNEDLDDLKRLDNLLHVLLNTPATRISHESLPALRAKAALMGEPFSNIVETISDPRRKDDRGQETPQLRLA